MPECMDAILQKMKVQQVSFAFVEGVQKLYTDNIIYVESNRHKSVFFYLESEIVNYRIYDKLDHIEQQLSGTGFCAYIELSGEYETYTEDQQLYNSTGYRRRTARSATQIPGSEGSVCSIQGIIMIEQVIKSLILSVILAAGCRLFFETLVPVRIWRHGWMKYTVLPAFTLGIMAIAFTEIPPYVFQPVRLIVVFFTVAQIYYQISVLQNLVLSVSLCSAFWVLSAVVAAVFLCAASRVFRICRHG